MLAKVLIIGAVAAVAFAVEYPEGINPATCPNYPFCDEPIPHYMFPYAGVPYAAAPYAPAPYAAVRYADAPFIAAGYRALHPALCPNFPVCDPEVLKHHTPEGIPIPEWELPVATVPFAADKYPAGVDPALCPNYPYCDMEAMARVTREDIPAVEIPAAAAVEVPTANERRR